MAREPHAALEELCGGSPKNLIFFIAPYKWALFASLELKSYDVTVLCVSIHYDNYMDWTSFSFVHYEAFYSASAGRYS